MKRAILIGGALVLVVLIVLGGIVLVRALTLEPVPVPEVESAGLENVHVDLASVERLAGALRIRTVSRSAQEPPPEASLRRLRRYLASRFPLVHRDLERQVVAGGSLLFTWHMDGNVGEPGAAPLVLLAHQDVVPVEQGTSWTHPPFRGVVDEKFVWGRGAMDDKGSLVAILEAIEGMIRDGAEPSRPVILAFGHDEEVGGAGARAMAAELERRGVEPFLVLDEGLAVVEGMMPGLEAPIAMIGVAEKGYLSLELVARGEGGHSSSPPRQTAVDVLVRALGRLREAPLPAGVDGPVEELFTTLAPEMDFDKRLVLANLWLFEPLVVRDLSVQPGTDALMRTTIAPTMLSGSVKDNVLPSQARAVVNFRLHPRDDAEAVIEHVRRAIADPRVEVSTYGDFASEPSPVSPTDGPAFALIRDTLRRVAPGALVAPSLVLGGTDARHYTGLTPNVYRFVPFTVGPGDLERVHGTDERLAIEDYQRMVRFYRGLMTGD
jgi:carboxypeptidase PM20D1